MANDARVGWVDYGKGLCILLVVMFHTTNHYEEAVHAEGWMRSLVSFAKPFRMPDFFMISGLFLARTIDAPLRTFIDRKVIHFAYFYLLWLAITLVVTDNDVLRSGPLDWLALFGWNVLQPVGTLWFVHMLAVFFVVVRLVRRAPPAIVLLVAAALQMLRQWPPAEAFVQHHTGIDVSEIYVLARGLDYFVYFFAGYWLAGAVFRFAEAASRHPAYSLSAIGAWAIANAFLVDAGVHFLPGGGLMLGFAGALAIVAVSSLLAQSGRLTFLRYCGRNSIVIYLAFYFPMLALERVLSKAGVIADVGTATLVILVLSVILPLALHAVIRRTPLNFLFERPAWARIADKSKPGFVQPVARGYTKPR